jgi:hypothetical protein
LIDGRSTRTATNDLLCHERRPTRLMDDRRAHFLTMLGDACAAAGLAGIPVELALRDGTRMAGTPWPQLDDGHPVDETGFTSALLIDGASTRLEDVVEFVIRSP